MAASWFDNLTRRQSASIRLFHKICKLENRLALSKLPFRKFNFMYPMQTNTLRPLCWVLGHFPIFHYETAVIYCNMCGKTLPKGTEPLD